MSKTLKNELPLNAGRQELDDEVQIVGAYPGPEKLLKEVSKDPSESDGISEEVARLDKDAPVPEDFSSLTEEDSEDSEAEPASDHDGGYGESNSDWYSGYGSDTSVGTSVPRGPESDDESDNEVTLIQQLENYTVHHPFAFSQSFEMMTFYATVRAEFKAPSDTVRFGPDLIPIFPLGIDYHVGPAGVWTIKDFRGRWPWSAPVIDSIEKAMLCHGFFGLVREPSRGEFLDELFEQFDCANKTGEDDYQRWINLAVQHKLMAKVASIGKSWRYEKLVIPSEHTANEFVWVGEDGGFDHVVSLVQNLEMEGVEMAEELLGCVLMKFPGSREQVMEIVDRFKP